MERRAEHNAGPGQQASQPRGEEPRFDVKSHVAQALIDAMEKGETPWQKPWSSASLRPTNPTSQRGYRGVNRILLSLARSSDGALFGDNRWVTYQQAQSKGWQVRGGEKGTMIVKVVEVDRDRSQPGNGAAGVQAAEQGGAADEKQRKAIVLRRYFVFNAEQVDGVPPMEASNDLDFDPVEKAEQIMSALKEKTGLLVVHGGAVACYRPELDEIRLPTKKKFHSVYDYYATALHEAAHSTLHAKRLDRKEALGKKWGDEAYAVEELRAEITSAVLAAETGITMSEPEHVKHMKNHVGYLQSWIKAVRSDPLAIFTAARDAERMTDYLLHLAHERTAMEPHKEWLAEYDATPHH